MLRTSDQWIREYQRKDALWIHDGNPKRPHAILTSGKHSSGFFNSRLIIPDEALLRDAASDLLELFVAQGGEIVKVQGVVGPQTGATRLAELLSEQICGLTRSECFSASPAKHGEGDKKSMVFSDEDRELVRGSYVLACDDASSTAGSIELTCEAVDDIGGAVMPFALVLVNRSGLSHVNGRKIIALIDHSLPMWDAHECPLCMVGSEAIRPKGPPEWARLNGTY